MNTTMRSGGSAECIGAGADADRAITSSVQPERMTAFQAAALPAGAKVMLDVVAAFPAE